METFLSGTNIGQWRIVETLGSGSFGSVYSCVNDYNRSIKGAIKVEQQPSGLRTEYTVLQRINKLPPSESKFFPKYLAHGEGTQYPLGTIFDYVVMSAAEIGLEELMRNTGGRFSLGTSIEISIQLLRALNILHRINVLHNDIKIVNLLMDRKRQLPSDRGLVNRLDQLIVVDFGLSEPFQDTNGVQRPQKGVQFRGSTQWASINCHAELTKCRQDDLESWFYVLVALHKGSLPWHFVSAQNRANVKEMKMSRRTGGLNPEGRNDALNNLLGGFPEDFVRLLAYIDRLTYYAEPNYDWIEGVLKGVLGAYNLNGLNFDWQDNRTQERWQQPQHNSDLVSIYDGP